MRRTVILGLVIIQSSICLADGGPNEWSEKVLTPTPGIQPTLDPRLPPVLPGEPVARGGKKMNVWSTAGSPSGVRPPEVPEPGKGLQDDSIDIIVDRRKSGHPK